MACFPPPRPQEASITPMAFLSQVVPQVFPSGNLENVLPLSADCLDFFFYRVYGRFFLPLTLLKAPRPAKKGLLFFSFSLPNVGSPYARLFSLFFFYFSPKVETDNYNILWRAGASNAISTFVESAFAPLTPPPTIFEVQWKESFRPEDPFVAFPNKHTPCSNPLTLFPLWSAFVVSRDPDDPFLRFFHFTVPPRCVFSSNFSGEPRSPYRAGF